MASALASAVSRSTAYVAAAPAEFAAAPQTHSVRHLSLVVQAKACVAAAEQAATSAFASAPRGRQSARRRSISTAAVADAAKGSDADGKEGEQPHEAFLTDHLTVGDCMTTSIICATLSTTVEEALELLVEHRITGLPVVDDDGKLVGVVSDYDLLAIDSISGASATAPSTGGLFPEAGSSWKAFKEIQRLLLKTKGKVVGDVMTAHPLTVRESTNLDQAARILLDSRFRRLPVLDSEGKLVGLLTRGNVVRAALEWRKTHSPPPPASN